MLWVFLISPFGGEIRVKLGQPVFNPWFTRARYRDTADVALANQRFDNLSEGFGGDLHALEQGVVIEPLVWRFLQFLYHFQAERVEGIVGHIGLRHKEHAFGLVHDKLRGPVGG